MNSKYSFTSVWQINAPRSSVWNAIYDFPKWSLWWSSVKEAKVIEQKIKENGVGSRMFFTFQGVLPYKLHFTMMLTDVKKYEVITGEAGGELEGLGRWNFSEQDGLTIVTYDWNVSLTKPWMRFFSLFLRPIFKWNHDYVMSQGRQGLKQYLIS